MYELMLGSDDAVSMRDSRGRDRTVNGIEQLDVILTRKRVGRGPWSFVSCDVGDASECCKFPG